MPPWAGPPGARDGGVAMGIKIDGEELKQEELGPKKILDITAYGFRTTRTICSGDIGNEVEIK
jgi:hypothetical protein